MFHVIGSIILCWMPITVYFFAIAFSQDRLILIDLGGSLGRVLHSIAVMTVHTNAAIDPIIYAYQMQEVRDGFKKLFKLLKEPEETAPNTSTNAYKDNLTIFHQSSIK